MQTCKEQTMQGLDIMYNYKNLKKKNALLLMQNFRKIWINNAMNM